MKGKRLRDVNEKKEVMEVSKEEIGVKVEKVSKDDVRKGT